MNNKRSGFRGFGVYLILVLAVIAIWYWLDGNNVTNTYTRQQFETALAEGKVTQVNVVPNREVPTGSVNITFSDSSTQVMLVSDVAEIEQYMRDAGFKTYTVQNPPEEMLAFDIASISDHFCCNVHFLYDHDQSGCSKLRRRKQDDELWQEPCEKNE